MHLKFVVLVKKKLKQKIKFPKNIVMTILSDKIGNNYKSNEFSNGKNVEQ